MVMLLKGTPTFNKEKGTLILQINEKDLDFERVQEDAGENNFRKKDEFHITVFGFRVGRAIKDALQKNPGVEIESLIQSTNWEVSLKPEYYYIAKYYANPCFEKGRVKLGERRESMIQMVDIPSGVEFYDKLNTLLGTSFTLQPFHITLYTKGDDLKTSTIGIAIESAEEFQKLNPRPISEYGKTLDMGQSYQKIILPTRPQPDTIVAISLLRLFGRDKYPGIENASVEVLSILPEGETEESLQNQGVFLIDIGGGAFDHHNKNDSTASRLVAEDLGVEKYPALAKLLQYAERDDKYGMGTVSEDQLDRAFGLSGMIAALNKSIPDDPQSVVDYIFPFVVAHYLEELKRTEGLPKEFREKQESGKAEVLTTKHKKKKIVVAVIESDDPSMAGWLRSTAGVKADVVIQKNSKGYVNIVTNQIKRIDLRQAIALLRKEEGERRGQQLRLSMAELTRPGRVEQIPGWYYDRATNSLLNGGTIPRGIDPTVIPLETIRDLTVEGLSGTIEHK